MMVAANKRDLKAARSCRQRTGFIYRPMNSTTALPASPIRPSPATSTWSRSAPSTWPTNPVLDRGRAWSTGNGHCRFVIASLINAAYDRRRVVGGIGIECGGGRGSRVADGLVVKR
jgi:hypothetical protein